MIEAIVILLILIVVFLIVRSENFMNPTYRGHIRLYDNFVPANSYQTFEYIPNPYKISYIKTIVKIPLKYIDISLTEGDERRKIEIYGMYGREQTASNLAEGVHHSAYLEPDWFLNSGTEKYTLLAKIKSGEHFKGPPSSGFKKVMIVAII